MTRPADPLAVRLEDDVVLPDALLAAARRAQLEFADVCGFGLLDWMEVDRGGTAVRIDGPLELLDLKGRIRRVGDQDLAQFVVTASRFSDAGLQVLGGALVRASCRYLELRLTPLAALVATASVATASVATPSVATPHVYAPPAPAPVVELKPNAGSKALSEKWAEALAESKRFEKSGAAAKAWADDEGPAQVVPQRGDVVNHRQFGRCLVAKIDDDHISLKKPDGRIVQLGLPILDFSVQGAEGAVTVFEVQVRRG
jgi:predicted DNA-binding protein with PD1-like motif